jgi:hypothetical protein
VAGGATAVLIGLAVVATSVPEEERILSVSVVNVVQPQVEASTGATSIGSPRGVPTA